jgi:hypothetical protein
VDEVHAVRYVLLVESLASVLAICGRTSDAAAFLGAAALVLAPFAAACLGVVPNAVTRTKGVALVVLSALAFLGYLALALEPVLSGASFGVLSLCHLAGCTVILALPGRGGSRVDARPSAVVVRGDFRWHTDQKRNPTTALTTECLTEPSSSSFSISEDTMPVSPRV